MLHVPRLHRNPPLRALRCTDAPAAAALPDLQSDVEEARAHLTSATKRRNALVLAISRARNERRRQAKVKHAPPRPQAKSRGDKFMDAFSGRERAA